eukprot:11284922-Alexandrium_andersonii.AAC.1
MVDDGENPCDEAQLKDNFQHQARSRILPPSKPSESVEELKERAKAALQPDTASSADAAHGAKGAEE